MAERGRKGKKGSLDYSRFEDIGSDEEEEEEDGSSGLAEVGYPEELKGLAENPLWTTILGLAGGDGARALEMMQDPDTLQRHPEILALFEEGGDGGKEEEEEGEEVDGG